MVVLVGIAGHLDRWPKTKAKSQLQKIGLKLFDDNSHSLPTVLVTNDAVREKPTALFKRCRENGIPMCREDWLDACKKADKENEKRPDFTDPAFSFNPEKDDDGNVAMADGDEQDEHVSEEDAGEAVNHSDSNSKNKKTRKEEKGQKKKGKDTESDADSGSGSGSDADSDSGSKNKKTKKKGKDKEIDSGSGTDTDTDTDNGSKKKKPKKKGKEGKKGNRQGDSDSGSDADSDSGSKKKKPKKKGKEGKKGNRQGDSDSGSDADSDSGSKKKKTKKKGKDKKIDSGSGTDSGTDSDSDGDSDSGSKKKKTTKRGKEGKGKGKRKDDKADRPAAYKFMKCGDGWEGIALNSTGSIVATRKLPDRNAKQGKFVLASEKPEIKSAMVRERYPTIYSARKSDLPEEMEDIIAIAVICRNDKTLMLATWDAIDWLVSRSVLKSKYIDGEVDLWLNQHRKSAGQGNISKSKTKAGSKGLQKVMARKEYQ